MKSHTTKRFRKTFESLPAHIRQKATDAFRQFQRDPYHPSLHFKQVHATQPIFSVRITHNYRAVGLKNGNTIIWFWIGSHEAYNKLLSQL